MRGGDESGILTRACGNIPLSQPNFKQMAGLTRYKTVHVLRPSFASAIVLGFAALFAASIAADSGFVLAQEPVLSEGISINTPMMIDSDIAEAWSIIDTPEVPVDRFRRGFFQGGEILGGFLGDGGGEDLGIDETTWEARLAFGVPLGSFDNIMVVQPFFRADHLNGPTQVDAPSTLYSTGATFFHRKQWNERISTIAILTPSVRSDFTTSDNAFRLFGLGLVNWQCRDELSIGLGAVYLDRADLGVLPAVGLTWTPNPWWKIDLIMPRPQINRRLWKDGGFAEGWAFAGASLGGNTWAVTREAGLTAGESDELTLSGIRLFAGYEKFQTGNRGWKVETGYVFNRSLEYESDNIELDLADALFIEATWKF